ncbi:MAG: histidine kinase dimerization/phospho-acceptor domain-containing protein, partial [Methanoregula sp.]|nr:histidine kinase dimerization/phospho-acceptor domain-containing protein [Methanoregula sp.]
ATKAAEEAKQHAENAMNSKQRFLSNMSHEIRTPLNSIMGFTKILLKTDLNDKQKEFLLAIKTSSDTLIVLINDILDLAKVDAGKMVFEKRVFNLEESISAILHLFEPKILEKNLTNSEQVTGNSAGALLFLWNLQFF